MPAGKPVDVIEYSCTKPIPQYRSQAAQIAMRLEVGERVVVADRKSAERVRDAMRYRNIGYTIRKNNDPEDHAGYSVWRLS